MDLFFSRVCSGMYDITELQSFQVMAVTVSLTTANYINLLEMHSPSLNIKFNYSDT